MKKFCIVVLALVIILTAFTAVACTANEHEVVIKIEKSYDLSKGDRLIDYMEYLDDKDKLDFDEKGGMIISINDIDNTLNSFWMLYTDDPNNSNKTWGTYEYKNKTYYSATLGATELKINKEYTYIWVYQKF